MKRMVTAIVLMVAILVLDAGVANATATVQQIVRTTTSEDYLDIGCHEQDLVHLEGEVTMHEVDERRPQDRCHDGRNRELHRRGRVLLRRVRSELHDFVACRRVSGDDPGVHRGPARRHRDTAILHITVHATFLASSGNLVTAFAILHQSCNA